MMTSSEDYFQPCLGSPKPKSTTADNLTNVHNKLFGFW